MENCSHIHRETNNFSAFDESRVTNRDENETCFEDDINYVMYITNSGAKITYGYFAICTLTVILAGWMIFLNGLVIHTLLHSKRHSDITDYFVSSLSFADLVTGILLLYVTSYSLIQYQNFWECLLRFGLTYAVSQSSFTHILAITIDRYVKIIFPLRYFSMVTKRTVMITSSIIWSFSIFIGLLPLLGWHKEYKANNNSDTVCSFFGVIPDGYFILNFVTSLIISIVTISLYVHVIYVAVQKRKQMHLLMEGCKLAQTHFDDQTWRVVKTVAIIVLVSNLCWLPGVVVIVLHILGKLDQMSYETRGDLITFCGAAVFLNSLINPLIYAVKIDAVKERFCSVLCCKSKNRGIIVSQSTSAHSSTV